MEHRGDVGPPAGIWRSMLNWQLIIAAAIALVACASASTREGAVWTVVDASSGAEAPVEGALLLFTYQGTVSALVHSSTSCFDMSLTKSGKDGHFVFPTDAEFAGAYKSGMVYADEREYDTNARKVILKKSSGRAESLKRFKQATSEGACRSAGDRVRPVAEYLAMILPDLREFASDPESREALREVEARYEMYRGVIGK